MTISINTPEQLFNFQPLYDVLLKQSEEIENLKNRIAELEKKVENND